MMQASKIVAVYEEAQASQEVREPRAWLERKRSGELMRDLADLFPER
jgi:hypothetical protein